MQRCDTGRGSGGVALCRIGTSCNGSGGEARPPGGVEIPSVVSPQQSISPVDLPYEEVALREIWVSTAGGSPLASPDRARVLHSRGHAHVHRGRHNRSGHRRLPARAEAPARERACRHRRVLQEDLRGGVVPVLGAPATGADSIAHVWYSPHATAEYSPPGCTDWPAARKGGR
jgi:hypothetical protein